MQVEKGEAKKVEKRGDREQVIQINGIKSIITLRGVPQRSILGPLFFSLFVSPIHKFCIT